MNELCKLKVVRHWQTLGSECQGAAYSRISLNGSEWSRVPGNCGFYTEWSRVSGNCGVYTAWSGVPGDWSVYI